jgi:hypothetical protein
MLVISSCRTGAPGPRDRLAARATRRPFWPQAEEAIASSPPGLVTFGFGGANPLGGVGLGLLDAGSGVSAGSVSGGAGGRLPWQQLSSASGMGQVEGFSP